MTYDNSLQDGDKKTEETPNSVIKLVLDQFAITQIFKKIISKTSWKATDQLNDAIVLFLFLLALFLGTQQLKPEFSLAIVTLIVLFILIIVEFVGANSPYFSRLFFSEEKTEHFIKNIGSIPSLKIEKNIGLLTFSPRNINSLLTIIQSDKDRIHPYIIDRIFLQNNLSSENLDRICSIEILSSYIRRDLIIDLLLKYDSQLSPNNIKNIFSRYHDDEQLVKLLLATQIDSDSLIISYPDNSFLKKYYEIYQRNPDMKSKILSNIQRTQFDVIPYRIIALLILWPLSIIGLLTALKILFPL